MKKFVWKGVVKQKKVNIFGQDMYLSTGMTHVAVDESGYVFAFTGEPMVCGSRWDPVECVHEYLGYVDLADTDWTTTLTKIWAGDLSMRNLKWSNIRELTKEVVVYGRTFTLPVGVCYIAIDACGDVWGFSEGAHTDNFACWVTYEGWSSFIGTVDLGDLDWTKTLVKV